MRTVTRCIRFPATVVLVLFSVCLLCRAAGSEVNTAFEQMTAKCLSVITNRSSSDADLLEAISHLGRMSEPPRFWTAIIQDPHYNVLHRKRCVMALFRRHGGYHAHAADLANVLDAARWLPNGDMMQVGAITGSIPVDVNIDDTIFLIKVLDQEEPEGGKDRKPRKFGIYMRVLGKVTLEEFRSVVRTGRPSTGDGNIIIAQYGYADDYEEWLRELQDRPAKSTGQAAETLAEIRVGKDEKGAFITTNSSSPRFYLISEQLHFPPAVGTLLYTNIARTNPIFEVVQYCPHEILTNGTLISKGYLQRSGRCAQVNGRTLTLSWFKLDCSYDEQPRDKMLRVELHSKAYGLSESLAEEVTELMKSK